MKGFKKIFVTISLCAISAISSVGFVGCGNLFEKCEHDWETVEVIKEATCTKEGKKVVVCKVCQKEKKQKIEKAPHVEVITEMVLPGCTTPGKTDGVICGICEAVLVAPQELQAIGHIEEVDGAVDPTCTQQGLSEGSHCLTCNEVIKAQEEVPATGHYISIIKGKDATCTEEGLTDGQVCLTCGIYYVQQKAIPKKSHTFDENGKCTGCGIVEE